MYVWFEFGDLIRLNLLSSNLMGREMKNNDTLATDCINNIRELILSGELFPGERLKGEYLKQKFKVGLSPIWW